MITEQSDSIPIPYYHIRDIHEVSKYINIVVKISSAFPQHAEFVYLCSGSPKQSVQSGLRPWVRF